LNRGADFSTSSVCAIARPDVRFVRRRVRRGRRVYRAGHTVRRPYSSVARVVSGAEPKKFSEKFFAPQKNFRASRASHDAIAHRPRRRLATRSAHANRARDPSHGVAIRRTTSLARARRDTGPASSRRDSPARSEASTRCL
jgi:hypothetical protein